MASAAEDPISIQVPPSAFVPLIDERVGVQIDALKGGIIEEINSAAEAGHERLQATAEEVANMVGTLLETVQAMDARLQAIEKASGNQAVAAVAEPAIDPPEEPQALEPAAQPLEIEQAAAEQKDKAPQDKLMALCSVLLDRPTADSASINDIKQLKQQTGLKDSEFQKTVADGVGSKLITIDKVTATSKNNARIAVNLQAVIDAPDHLVPPEIRATAVEKQKQLAELTREEWYKLQTARLSSSQQIYEAAILVLLNIPGHAIRSTNATRELLRIAVPRIESETPTTALNKLQELGLIALEKSSPQSKVTRSVTLSPKLLEELRAYPFITDQVMDVYNQKVKSTVQQTQPAQIPKSAPWKMSARVRKLLEQEQAAQVTVAS